MGLAHGVVVDGTGSGGRETEVTGQGGACVKAGKGAV